VVRCVTNEVMYKNVCGNATMRRVL
jgi:hypothetical protein